MFRSGPFFFKELTNKEKFYQIYKDFHFPPPGSTVPIQANVTRARELSSQDQRCPNGDMTIQTKRGEYGCVPAMRTYLNHLHYLKRVSNRRDAIHLDLYNIAQKPKEILDGSVHLLSLPGDFCIIGGLLELEEKRLKYFIHDIFDECHYKYETVYVENMIIHEEYDLAKSMIGKF